MPENSDHFSKKLITWYLRNKRSLPWRETKDAYRIWLSEIMLQQTRVDQGLPYYLKFVSEFPTIQHLATASEDKVLKLWQGLGYYSRARNLHYTAQYVANELGGKFPNNYKDLLALKGVGDYTASAIASICFGLPTAVVDGNVYRVLARYFNINTPINSSEGIKQYKALAQELLDPQQPGDYNQAIMEFGARQCTPQNPDCSACVLKDSCLALRHNSIKNLPVKIKKTKVKRLYFNYLVVVSENERTILQQRIEKGIWHKLYEFPLIETIQSIEKEQLVSHSEFKRLLKDVDIRLIERFNDAPIVHKLSHRHIDAYFWIVETHALGITTTAIDDVNNYAMPVLISNFVSEFSGFKNAKF